MDAMEYFRKKLKEAEEKERQKKLREEEDIAPVKRTVSETFTTSGGGGRSFGDSSKSKEEIIADFILTGDNLLESLKKSSEEKKKEKDKLGLNGVLGSVGNMLSLADNSVKKTKENELPKWLDVLSKVSPGIALGAKVYEADQKGGKERTWFNEGSFSDGYQFGDVTTAILGTLDDAVDDFEAGAISVIENTIDAGATGAGVVGGWFGADDFKEDMAEFVAKDFIDEEAVAKNQMFSLYSALARAGLALQGWEDSEDVSVLGDKSDALVQSGGQLASQVMLQGVKVPWWATTGVTSFGSGTEAALQNGANLDQAATSGAVRAATDILTEKMFGDSILGEKGLIDMGPLTKGITNKVAKTAADYGIDLATNGIEELTAEVAGNIADGWIYRHENGESWEDILWDEEAIDGYIEATIGGSVLGGVTNTGKAINSAKTGSDYRTGLSADDQIVFDKEAERRIKEAVEKAEKDGKKLTNSEKKKIYAEVMEDIDNGDISVDSIEEYLGGDTYNTFKTEKDNFFASDDYKAYRDSFAEEQKLNDELEKIKGVKTADATLGDQDRLGELKTKLEDLKTKRGEQKTKLDAEAKRINQIKAQLRSEAMGRVKDGKLGESYRELLRSTEKFTADPTKYKSEHAQKTVQNIMDSGLTDNSRKMHRFVEFLAKIADDRGVTFSVTDAKKMAGTVNDMKGATANAWVEGNEITINMDSKKRLNSLAGHEITHVLEGTQFYNELSKAVQKYAVEKGEWNKRLSDTTALYKKYKPNADPVKEVVADLVGDYLFTDRNFVMNLSTKNRNLFQKVYDEIKYLLKMATAGSQEARDLERVKREFEKAWRAAPKADAKVDTEKTTDTKHSISADGKQLSQEQEEFFKDSVVRDENGNLKPMYHGTANGGHTVFDTYGSKYGLFGAGSYFTDSKTVAEKYTDKYNERGNDNKQVYETYLNITNPMDMDAQANPAEWQKAFPEASFPESGTNEEFYRAMEEYFYDEMYSKGEAAEIAMDALIGMGYDGITHIGGGRVNRNGERHQVYIAFHPEQIKNTDNVNPTEDPDIRYSISEDSDGNRLTEEQNEFFKDSKMRDDNGNLIPMYHGTQKGGYTVFDPNYSDDGISLFFVDRNEVAMSYSGTSETFAPRSFKTADDMNSFFKEIDATEYSVVEEDGQFKLLEDGDEIAVSDNLDTIYQEFTDWAGVGYGDVNYKVYLNLTNPLVIDAKGAEWSEIKIPKEHLAKFNESVYLTDDPYGYLDTGVTRDFAQYAKEQGYDGVIFKNLRDNGGYSNGSEGASTVAIAFDSNQVKSVANTNPTPDNDIRYSLTEDTKLADKAIAKNDEFGFLDSELMTTAKAMRERVANQLRSMKENGVAIPDDFKGKTAIANSSYDITEENTTICPRSLAAEAFVDAVSEYLGRPLSVEEQIYISQDLQGRSLTPECTYCYVATDRKAYRQFLGEYIKQRDAVLDKLESNPNADISRSGELYKEFLGGRKDTNPMYNRFKMWVDAYKKGTPMIDGSHLANMNRLMGDINEFGAELKPQIVDAMKYAQSASWAKKRVSYVSYDGHILNWKPDRIKKLNSHYGLRMYSFSDFHPAFVLENMQMITDAAVRGLKMLGYTKDTDFVEIFAPTGMNINISTFGFESGGNVYENNVIGANWDKAKALREQNPNVGITFVATSDSMVEWALAQDWVDVVIPYHLVRTGEAVANAFDYKNFTSESSDTKKKEWSKGDNKYIAPTEHNNDKATYLAALAKNNLNPRFEKWLDNPNYMKLVNECRQPASMSQPVKPIFNENAIDQALGKLRTNGYYQPVGGSVDRMYEIAAEVAENMPTDLQSVDTSKRGWVKDLPKHSISADNSTDTNVGGYSVYGNDVKLRDPADFEFDPLGDIAPIANNVQNDTKIAMDVPDEQEAVEEFAPVKAEDAEAVNDISTITDEDAPPEMDAPMPESEPTKPYDPFKEKDIKEVGKRNVKAYMFEHPEVKPYFQEEANIMLGELRDTVKGERLYNEDGSWTGTSRHTSEDIAYLRDALGYSYAEIEKGLNDIIEDNGKENNAVAKRIEFLLNDRLLKGYRDFSTGMDIPANEGYVRLMNSGQMMSYDDGYMDSLVESTPPPADDFAPVRYDSSVENASPPADTTAVTDEAPIADWYKNALGIMEDSPANPAPPPPAPPAEPPAEIGRILTEEPNTKRNRISGWKKFVSLFVDKGNVFETLSKKLKNRELEARYNSMHYSEGNAQTFIGKGDEDKGIMALNDIRKQIVDSGKEEAFSYYLYHLHNMDRMSLSKRGFGDDKAVFGNNITADMSRVSAANLESKNPEFRQLANEIYKINHHLRQMLVDNGIISQETADLWQKMYPHYVPIRREGHDGLAVNVPLDTNKTGVNAPVKRATGGNSNILPMFDTMAQRILQTYKAVAKNRFGVELKNTMGTEFNRNAETVEGILDSMDKHDELLKKGEHGMSPTFTVFENGQRVEFEITEEMYDALAPTNDFLSRTIKPLNTISNIRRGLITEYNPVFLVTNAIKDSQDVLINSQHPARTYWNMPQAAWQMLSNGKWYKEYMANGGEQNTYFEKDSNTFKEKSAVRKVVGFPLDAIAAANNFVERLPRLAEYMASRKAKRSIDVSMLDAARVTTNFAAGGDVTKWANRNGATFLNASVQGAAQNVRNVREAYHNGIKGWAQLAAKTAIAGLPAVLLNHLLWEDDEEYEELSDYVKENYYIVAKFGDGQFVRIPKGRTVAVIQEAFQQMYDASNGEPLDLGALSALVVNNLAPNNPLDNNIASPIIQAFANKAWHGGNIVPQSMEDIPAEEQYDEGTSSIARWIGEATGTSPMKWNYVLDQYSGGLGDTFLPMMTPEAERGDDSFLGKMVAPWVDKFTTDSVLNNQNVSDFYDLKDELAINANSSKATDDDVLMSKYMNSVSAELNALYTEKREIQNSNMSDSRKYEAVRDVQEQINERMKDAMSIYEDVEYEVDAKTGGRYAVIGGKYFKETEGKYGTTWSILDEDETKKYQITSAAGDANYATDGETHYRWYVPDEDSNEEPGWKKVTDTQLKKQKTVTRYLGITADEYWSNRDDETQKVYDWVYDNPEDVEIAKDLYGDVKSYYEYKTAMDGLDAKDANGNSVSGLKKERTINYINDLDLEYGQKIIMFKKRYPADDSYNYDIIDYLNSRDDISYNEMKNILLDLGFKVDSNGNITWD